MVRQLVDSVVLSCEGGGGQWPQRTVAARLRLPSSTASAASGDDSDW
jgi:hypothetical protein